MKQRCRLGISAACLILSACGGGGGGGTGGDGAVTVPPVLTSGLLPAAPSPGLTITADATVLRPLRAGAVWTYGGTITAYTGAPPTTYVTSTTQSAVTATAATESSSNSGNSGADTQPVTVSGGTVGSEESIDFAGKGLAERVQYVELRSPVRQGEQYPVLDKHYTDTNIDADGDKKTDALDVAIYARVVGTETLELPNLPRLTTVRVDTTLRTRVTYSSNGQTSPISEVVIQTWYASGIGIVRQLTTAPSASGNSIETTDEQLQAWDGIDSGFGALPAQQAQVPAGNAVYAGQSVPGGYAVYGAAALNDRALIATALPGSGPGDNGVLISRLDLRGKVVSSVAHAGLTMYLAKIHARTGGLLQVRTQSVSCCLVPRVSLTRFDSDGALDGNIDAAQIDLTGGRSNVTLNGVPVSAVDGSTLWLLWTRLTPTATGRASELVLRSYAMDGSPLGAELIVDSAEVVQPSMAVADGRLVAAWTRINPGVGLEAMAVTMASNASAPARLSVSTALQTYPGNLPVFRLGARSAVLWGGTSGGVTADGSMGGLLMDAAAIPIIAAGSSPADQPLSKAAGWSIYAPIASYGTRLVTTTVDYNVQLWPGDSTRRDADRISWFETSGAPLTSTVSTGVRMPSIGTLQQLVFADRVLLLGGSTTALLTAVVWMR